MTIKYPTPEQFMAALGKTHDSPEVKFVFEAMGVTWSDVKKFSKDLETRIYQSNELGFGFTFEDEGKIYEKPYHDIGDGPFIMTDCAFWGFNDETEVYLGTLFKDLQFSESLKGAEKKLGPATQFREGATRPYIWKINDKVRLTIHWPKPDKARVVTYWLITPGM